MGADGAPAVPTARGGLADHPACHHGAERAGGVWLQRALPQQSRARVTVDPVRHVRHVLATRRDGAPLPLSPRGLEHPERVGPRPLQRSPSVGRSSAWRPVLEVVAEAERRHG
eukprot:2709354-Lingulodinium_polyedra.AAC.1